MSWASTLFGEKDPQEYYNDVGQAPDPSKQAYTPEHQNAAQAHAQQGAILQGAQARGGVNAGSTLAAQLSAAQGAQQAGADAAVNVAGQAANRAQAANAQAGALGGQLDQTAFAKQATVGQAQNAINAANANSANKASEFNTGARNAASQFNIGNSIQAKQFLAALQQQQYENKLKEAAARAGLSLADSNQDLTLLGDVAGAAGTAGGIALKSSGGRIDGQATTPGDSVKNDTVPAMLSPGEIVLPRSVVSSPNKILAFLEKETGFQFDSAVKAASGQAKLKK